MELTYKRSREAGLPFAAAALVKRMACIHSGTLDVAVDGVRTTLTGERAGPAGQVVLHRPNSLLSRIVTGGAIGFAEAYMAGDWDSPDLSSLLWNLAENEAALGGTGQSGWWRRAYDRLWHARNANTRRGSRRNISYHYDLGNDFYRLWLDPGMTYSAACFDTPGVDLQTAQDHKYERLLALTGAQAGEHVLEIGCGWGGFAETAIKQGLQVTGVTLSREQLAWAQRRLADAGLAQHADLRLQDYRDISGRFDHIVSIEMFEAVGEAYWPTYMQRLADLLKPGGTAALQVIVIDPASFDGYRSQPDFIQRYIFPGGMLPTVEAFDKAAQSAGLRVVDRELAGLDYARTLAEWREAFNQQWPQIAELGYDQRFRRMWDYYLAYCEAGFRAGRIDLMRVALRQDG